MGKSSRSDNITDQKNKLKPLTIISLFDLAYALTYKSTTGIIDKNMTDFERQILHNSFYFQLENNNEKLKIYYIFNEQIIKENGNKKIEKTVLTEFFDHISITRNDKMNYLTLILSDHNNKKINEYKIGPFFIDNNKNIYNKTYEVKKNIVCPIKETVNHLLNLQKRICI
jgi:heat shock protein HspQ